MSRKIGLAFCWLVWTGLLVAGVAQTLQMYTTRTFTPAIVAFACFLLAHKIGKDLTK